MFQVLSSFLEKICPSTTWVTCKHEQLYKEKDFLFICPSRNRLLLSNSDPNPNSRQAVQLEKFSGQSIVHCKVKSYHLVCFKRSLKILAQIKVDEEYIKLGLGPCIAPETGHPAKRSGSD